MNKHGAKYLSVYKEIKKEILEEIYPPGSFLPPEGELIEKYGVSRTTIRRAVTMLKNEHLLDVRQGRGTQVLQGKKVNTPYNFLSVKSSSYVTSRFTIGDQCASSSQGALIDIIPAETKVAEALQLSPGTSVYRLQRIKSVNDTIFSYVTSYVPTTLAPDLESYNGEILFLYKFLQEHYGISYENSTDVISASTAGFIESHLLNVKPGTPLLVFRRVTYSKNIPFEYSESINRADLLEIVIDSQAAVPASYF